MFGLGKIFGSQKVAGKMLDGLLGGIDKAFYTDQEKAEAKKEAFNQVLQWQTATTSQDSTRRFIAVSLMLSFLFFIFLLFGVQVWGVFEDNPDMSYKIGQLTNLGKENVEVMSNLVTYVMVFYFAPHLMKQIGVGLFGRKQDTANKK